MSRRLHFLILDAYDDDGRRTLRAAGATQAGVLFEKMIAAHLPEARTDIIFPADPQTSLPAGMTLSDYDGIVWTGSNLTAFHDKPNVRRQIDLARSGFQSATPMFGSCWAIQIAAIAVGGSVAANEDGRHFGLARKISMTPAGRDHPLYADKPEVFDGLVSHQDAVKTLPDSATILASNYDTFVLGLEVNLDGGSFWATQYHTEYDLAEIAALLRIRKNQLVKQGTMNNEEEAEETARLFESLNASPARKDLAWRLGVGQDILDIEIRQLEFRNWLTHKVMVSTQD